KKRIELPLVFVVRADPANKSPRPNHLAGDEVAQKDGAGTTRVCAWRIHRRRHDAPPSLQHVTYLLVLRDMRSCGECTGNGANHPPPRFRKRPSGFNEPISDAAGS